MKQVRRPLSPNRFYRPLLLWLRTRLFTMLNPLASVNWLNVWWAAGLFGITIMILLVISRAVARQRKAHWNLLMQSHVRNFTYGSE